MIARANPDPQPESVTIPVDFFAAMMAAHLTDRARTILAEAVLQRCGPNRRVNLTIDVAAIEAATGLHRNNARRGLKELVKAGILQQTKTGAYQLVRDYAAWHSSKANPKPVHYAKAVLSRTEIPANASTGAPIQLDSHINGRPNPTGFSGNPTGLTTDVRQSSWIGPDAYESSITTPEMPTHCGDSRAHLGAAARGLLASSSLPLGEEIQKQASVGAPRVRGAKPAYPGPGAIVHKGDFDCTEAEARSFFDQLWDSFHLPSVCLTWWQERNRHDIRAWQHAVRRLRDGGTQLRKFSLLATIASEWVVPVLSTATPTTPIPPYYEITAERAAEIERGYAIEAERYRVQAEEHAARKRQRPPIADPDGSVSLGAVLAAKRQLQQSGE